MPKCSYFGCNKEATVAIPRANQFNCDAHWEINLLRFRCPGMFEKIAAQDKGSGAAHRLTRKIQKPVDK